MRSQSELDTERQKNIVSAFATALKSSLLSADKRENEIVGDEPDEGEESSEQRVLCLSGGRSNGHPLRPV